MVKVVNVALGRKLSEFTVQVFLVCDNLVVLSRVVFEVVVEVAGVGHVFDVERTALELLVGHVVQRESTNWGVLVFLPLSKIGDEVANLLFQL